MKYKTSVNPMIPTVKLDIGKRAFGKMIKAETMDQPQSVSQSDLLGDLFWKLFSNVGGAANIPASRQTNKTLIDYMTSGPGWEEAKQSTHNNVLTATKAAGFMWGNLITDGMLEEAFNAQKEAEEAEKEAANKRNQAKANRAAAEGMRNEEGAGKEAEAAAEALEALAGQLEAEAEAAEAAAALSGQAAAEALEELADNGTFQAAISSMTKEAAEEAEEISQMMATYGLGAGSNEKRDPRAVGKFMKQYSRKIAQIAKIAGRMRGIALRVNREKVQIGPIPSDVGRTKKITDIFPSQLAFLREDAPPILRAKKVSQYARGGLTGYKRTGDSKEEGPVVVAVDLSGSMASNEVMVKGIAVGVCQAAATTGRPFILLSFAGTSDPIHIFDSEEGLVTVQGSKEKLIKHKGGLWGGLMQWAEKFQNGGTDYTKAFKWMIKSLDKLGKKARGVDAIFISDDAGHLTPQWRKRWEDYRDNKGSRLLFVPVGKSHFVDTLGDLPDQVIHLSELTETAAGDEFTTQLANFIR